MQTIIGILILWAVGFLASFYVTHKKTSFSPRLTFGLSIFWPAYGTSLAALVVAGVFWNLMALFGGNVKAVIKNQW